jgi:hypothetical protein
MDRAGTDFNGSTPAGSHNAMRQNTQEAAAILYRERREAI